VGRDGRWRFTVVPSGPNDVVLTFSAGKSSIDTTGATRNRSVCRHNSRNTPQSGVDSSRVHARNILDSPTHSHCSCQRTRVGTQMCIHTREHARTHAARTHARTRTYTHKQASTNTNASEHACMHVHTQVRTHVTEDEAVAFST
jgi:hypothetical protein